MKQRLYIKHHPKTFFLFGSDDDYTMVLLRLIGRKAEKAIKREMTVRKILRKIWRRNCNIFRNHMNKKKRLFVSK